MVEKILDGAPGGPATLLRAALPALPGVNLIPGIAKRGGALPDLVLSRRAVAIDPAHVTAYAALCGFEKSQTLPLTYPHMLGFPLHMAIMTDRSFPYPAVGMVHTANTIHQHRPLRPDELLDVSATATNLRAHPRGKTLDLVTTISVDGEPVWESTSEYLRFGKGDKEARSPREPFDVVPSNGVEWRLPANQGRRYAAVSGDHNPIHLYPLTAKALGFKRQIVHGMWSKARCVAAVATRLPDDVTVEVEFKKPVFLPSTVAFGSRVVADGLDFSLTQPEKGGPHLVGRSR